MNWHPTPRWVIAQLLDFSGTPGGRGRSDRRQAQRFRTRPVLPPKTQAGGGCIAVLGSYALNEAMFRLTRPAVTLPVFRQREVQDGHQEVTGREGFGSAPQAVGTGPCV